MDLDPPQACRLLAELRTQGRTASWLAWPALCRVWPREEAHSWSGRPLRPFRKDSASSDTGATIGLSASQPSMYGNREKERMMTNEREQTKILFDGLDPAMTPAEARRA